MTSLTTTHHPATDHGTDVSTGSGSRPWQLAGLGSAVATVVGLAAGSQVDAVYDTATKNDPAKIAEAILDSAGTVGVFHTATTVAALLILVFAAGLRLRLAERTSSRSIVPQVAAAGLGLVAVTQLIGTSLDTEFTMGARGNITPDAITFYGSWVNTVSWCWAGAGLTGLAVAVAAFRYGAMRRWVGVVGLVLGTVTTLFAVSPLEYMAAMTGVMWLLVTSVGLLAERRTSGDGHS